MTPEYVALRPEMTAAQALDAIRRSERRAETMSVLYVVDESGSSSSTCAWGRW